MHQSILDLQAFVQINLWSENVQVRTQVTVYLLEHLIHKCLFLMVLLFYIDVECREQGAIFYILYILVAKPFFYFLKEIYQKENHSF